MSPSSADITSKLISAFERMMRENDYFAPLDPDLLTAYATNNGNVTYEETNDIWALGNLY